MIHKRLATVAKAAISLLIIWFLLSRIDLAPVATRLSRLGPIQILLGLVPLIVQLALAAERWRLVCGRLGVTLRFSSAFQIVTIGMFFNQTLPSSVGGDAMRIWLLGRTHTAWGRAVSTVLCDRVLGLVVLIGLTVATLPLFYEYIHQDAAQIAITVVALGGAAGFAIFLVAGEWLARLLRRWKFSRPLGDLAFDFRRLFAISGATAVLVLWSLIIHLLTVVAAWLIARLLGIEAGLRDCLIVMPPVVLVMMLPVSIAGWGLREGAMVVGFGMVGVVSADALAISICYGLANLAIGLPGGMLWLRTRQRQGSFSGPNDAAARD